jgi:hypothetical protein
MVMVGICLVAGVVLAQDPGIPDTVRIECDQLLLNQSQPAMMTIVNDQPIAAFTLGFELSQVGSEGNARFDSVVYVGRMADPRVISERLLNTGHIDGNLPDTLGLVGFFVSDEVNLPEGNEPVAEIWMTGLAVGELELDSSFFPPNNLFKMVDVNNSYPGILPQFVGDAFPVVIGEEPPTISLSTNVIQTVVGDEIVVDITADSPQGYPLTLAMGDLDQLGAGNPDPATLPQIDGLTVLRWTPGATDVGVWAFTLDLCDSHGGCAEATVEIQVVESGTFLTEFGLYNTPSAINPITMASGNFDDDAYPELFVGGYARDVLTTAAVFELDENHEFLPTYAPVTNMLVRGAKRAYLDEDGLADIVFVNSKPSVYASAGIWVLLGNGHSSFSATQTSDYFGIVRGGALGNFINDQYLDYIAISGSKVWQFKGLAGGILTAAGEIMLHEVATSVNSADFNRDGLDDLAIGTESGLRIYLNNAAGSFSLLESHAQTYGSLDIEITNDGSDFNGDGFFDLCLATPSTAGTHSELVVYLGSASGSFTQHVVRIPAGHVLANCAADINGDGDLDIIYVNGSRDEAVVLFGDGDGTFTNELRYRLAGEVPQQVVATDFDLDGDVDLAVGCHEVYGTNVMVAMMNQSDPGAVSQTSVAITGFDNSELEVVTKSGRQISKIASSVPSGEYFQRNINGNAVLDDCVSVAVIESGTYEVAARPKPDQATSDPFSLKIEIDGEPYRLADAAPMSAEGYLFAINPDGDSPVSPVPGQYVKGPVRLAWPETELCDVEVASDIKFTNMIASAQTSEGTYQLDDLAGGTDSTIYYWRVKLASEAEFEYTNSFNLTPGSPTDAPGESDPLPGKFALSQNYPNPFNPSTTIEFALPRRSDVTVTVYNVLGQRVVTLVDDNLAIGNHRVDWNGTAHDGSPVVSGIYFYRIATDAFTSTKKMVLLR